MSFRNSLPLLVGDKRRFKQVMINLIKNALKFTTSGYIKIKIGYNYDINVIVVHIEDTGTGIAEKDLSKLFSLFGKLTRTA